METIKIMEAFTLLLAEHDWYFQMADDPSVYDRGMKEQEIILNIIKYSDDEYLREALRSMYFAVKEEVNEKITKKNV